jgi:hypothetical protein
MQNEKVDAVSSSISNSFPNRKLGYKTGEVPLILEEISSIIFLCLLEPSIHVRWGSAW